MKFYELMDIIRDTEGCELISTITNDCQLIYKIKIFYDGEYITYDLGDLSNDKLIKDEVWISVLLSIDRRDKIIDFLSKKTTERALKPCPFCGGEAVFYHHAHGSNRSVLVKCKHCFIKTEGLWYYDTSNYKTETEQRIAKIWNRRETDRGDL